MSNPSSQSDRPRLLILSKDSELDVLKGLSQVLKDHQNLQIDVSSDPPSALATPAAATLILGPQMLEFFQSAKMVPKNRSITSLRKSLLSVGRPAICSYNVGIVDVDYRQYVDLLTDVQLACRLASTGSLKPQTGAYKYVQSLDEYVQQVRQLIETNGVIDQGFDTETRGLDRFHPEGYLISLQFSHTPGTAQVLAFPSRKASLDWLWKFENQSKLEFLLNSPAIRTVCANGKYDLEWLYEHSGVTCSNFKFDTTAVGSLLDENRSNGLDVHAKIYTQGMGGYSDEFDAKADKSRMDLEYQKDPQGFLMYAGGDPDATLQVKHALKAELIQDSQLAGFYVNILHPSLRAMEQVERGGVCVDMEEYRQLEADLNQEIVKQVQRASKVLGGALVAKHFDLDKPGGLNLTKASLITDFMFTPHGLNMKPKMMTSGGSKGAEAAKPSTALEHVEMFNDHQEAREFVECVSAYSSATKTLGTYVHGFQKHIRSDGRFHPTYWLFAGNKDEDEGGTNTGRVSVKDPAFQTIPKHTIWGKRLRKCFPAPPGMLVLERDYSQGELKVMACLAHEQTMIKAYMNGMDLHVVTSGTVSGFTYEQMLELAKADPDRFDAIRQLGKAGNFGLIYGMGVDGFIEYARLNYRVDLSYKQAEEFRTGFFNTYPGLLTYHDQYKRYARRHGRVYSPLGRVRHLPLINSRFSDIRSKAERQAINSPVQGTLSDMMLWAIAIEHQLGWMDDAPCFGSIHDAGYNYIPEDNHVHYARRVVEVMENLPFERIGWAPQLKFTADAKVGPNMADLKKLKL